MSLAFVVTRAQIAWMQSEFEKPENFLSHLIIGASIEVHKQLGPGLMEKAYEACLVHELEARKIRINRQVPVRLTYKGKVLDCGFRADLIVEDKVLIEVKAVSALADIHKAQALTYLKLTGLRLCLILNFNTIVLRDGTARVVFGL